ncbi:MAG: flagellar basal body rod C-terminal domain-containing protein [Oscillospiraceae bacterium]
MTNSVLDQRDAVVGVSETEETANMLMYNKAFQAAARMMTTMDDMLDVIINQMAV